MATLFVPTNISPEELTMRRFVKKGNVLDPEYTGPDASLEFMTGAGTWATDEDGTPATTFDNARSVNAVITSKQDWQVILVRNDIDSQSDYVDALGRWHGMFYISNVGSNPDNLPIEFDIQLTQ